MLRRPTAARVSLIAATTLTVAVVAFGTMSASAQTGGSADRVAAEADQTRSTAVSRGGGRDKESLPPYQVVAAGAPVVKLPTPGKRISFQVGTLNILGSQHAGNGRARAAALADAILGRDIELVGLQEVQDDQLAVLRNDLPGYTIWPGQSLGNNGVRLQIAFDNAHFQLVRGASISTLFDHQYRPIPYVLLRNRATGGEFYVVDLHNSPGGQEAERDAATTREIALLEQLRGQGRTVLVMGDTNEFTEFACRVMAATGMVGYNGAHYDTSCHTGAGPLKIDWILGGGRVDFSRSVVDYSAPVGWATDHAFVHATVTMRPLAP